MRFGRSARGWALVHRAAAGAVFLLLVAGCKVDAAVDVDVESDGSGAIGVAVLLDDAALARLGDPNKVIRADDLRATGWTIAAPEKTKAADGSNRTLLRASKPFNDPPGFERAMAEVTGPQGLLRGFTLSRSKSFAKTSFILTGTIDPSSGVAGFSDADVSRALGGEPLGRPLGDVQKETASSSLVLTVDLPGSIKGAADERDGGTARYTIGFDQQPRSVALQSSHINSLTRFYTALAAALAVAAAVGFLAAWARRPRVSKGAAPTPLPLPPAVTRIPATARSAPATKPKLRVVVLDAMGVIFTEGDDVAQHLVPFVAERGGTASSGLIEDCYRQCSLGNMTTVELWARLGVRGDPDELDAAYVERFELNPEVLDFVDAMTRRGIRISCLSNDVPEWAELLRYRFDLVDKVNPWITSGAVGARKPDPAIYQALLDELDEPATACLLVDDRPTNLAAAAQMGFVTALYAPAPVDEPGFRQIRSLLDLLRTKTRA